jgi:CRISPR-associated protein Cas1
MKDLHILPRVRDSWSYLYVEHARIDQDAKAISIHDAKGKVPVPCASLTLLMLGPGTSITQAAIRTLAEFGCLVAWTGEEGVRFYAVGTGETRSAASLLKQARLVSDPTLRLAVAMNLYRARFHEGLDPSLTLQQIRGLEGVRVREAYARASAESGVAWGGRSYRRDRWHASDSVNRALSSANSCLYGVCHAAIVSVGYSPALGFIHTGKMLSFVYDVADLYKCGTTIPVAFEAAAKAPEDVERYVRRACRDRFQRERLMTRIVPDIDAALNVGVENERGEGSSDIDASDNPPGNLWDPEQGFVAGGVNRGNVDEEPK